MYIQDSVIYADAGEKLVGGKNSNITFVADAFKTGIDCKRAKTIKMGPCKLLQYGPGITMMMPSDSTYEALYKAFVNEGYTEEEKLTISLNKDASENDSTAYSNLLLWMEFSSKAAKLIAPTLGIDINETIEEAKNDKIAEITKYDSSSEVNSFKYGDMDLWLDKATRVGLMNSTAILQNAGQETTTLWLGSISATLPCTTVILMLSQIEMYALECYNVTAQHKAAVNALETIEEVKAYDYKTGYPTKPTFEAA